VQHRRARFVGAKLGQIQQRVEPETGRITGVTSLHHQHRQPQQ